MESLITIAETDPTALVLMLAAFMIILTIVGAVAGHLWTRWMGRVEQRLDIVEAEQRAIVKNLATREDITAIESRLGGRLDRMEIRMDWGGVRGPPDQAARQPAWPGSEPD